MIFHFTINRCMLAYKQHVFHWLVFTLFVLRMTGCEMENTNGLTPNNESGDMGRPGSSVRFNNPRMLQDSASIDDNAEGLYDFDTTQENADVAKFGGLNIRTEAKTLSARLRQLCNSEMRITSVQGMFDSLQYTDMQLDYWAKLTEVSKLISTKLNQYVFLLRTTRLTVENLYQQHGLKSPVDFRFNCCSVSNTELRWDDDYQMNINRDISCDLMPPNLPRFVFNPGRNITEVFQYNFQLIPSIKWQYFITMDGIHNEYPAHNNFGPQNPECRNVHDVRHRGILLSAIYPSRKNVVIVIDVGNSLSSTQLKIAKAISKHIVLSLSDNDRVGIVAVASDVKYPSLDKCALDRLVQLSNRTRVFLNRFIDGLEKESSAVNHSLAFSVAYDLTREISDIPVTDVLVAYISRGLLSSLTEPKDVLSVIGYENGRTGNRVIINTYAVVDDNKPVMYERTFLQDVADQNFSKYHVDRQSTMVSRRGKMVSVNSTLNLGVVIGDPFQPFNWTFQSRPVISLPQKDEVGKGVVVSIAWSCLKDGKPFGVVGLDLQLNEVVEPAMFQANDTSYMFVIDKKGSTVVHPMLDSLMLSDDHPPNTNISYFENLTGFIEVLNRIMSTSSGRATISIPVNASLPRTNTYGSKASKPMNIVYLWQHVMIEQSNEPVYIVVMKVVNESSSLRMIKTSAGSLRNDQQTVYHRLDLMPTDNNCVHFRQLATKDTSTVFLSSRAFYRPLEHINHQEVKRMVQGYLAYLNDGTNLISNPGILENVRKDVLATGALNAEWMRQSSSSTLATYIVRRYLALPSGLFRIYPGTLMSKSYDPSKRHCYCRHIDNLNIFAPLTSDEINKTTRWYMMKYMRALEHPGKIVLTPPYLDSGGAGYIMTISHTIYEGKSTALHGSSDPVAAVVGMDLSMKYVYKMLLDQIPVCNFDNIRCLIMDDRGYLIAHRRLADPSEQGPLKKQHITRKEPLVTNDILAHRGFVHKKTCSNYIDGTTQRSYQFNTSLDGIITNLVHGEHCARYQVMPIAGTNAFIGIVNQTCDIIRAFCPCSMYDRLCLNCLRMEQTECECPCECPLTSDICPKDNSISPSCSMEPDETAISELEDSLQDASLPPCFRSNCAQLSNKNDCTGVLDCDWCEFENDALTLLQQPFCGTQRTCFNGVLGAASPYQDEEVKVFVSLLSDNEALLSKSMPVGPVAGGIMGFFLLLALGVYCYRHHAHGHSRSCNGSLPGEGQLRDSNNDLEDFDDLTKGHTNIMLSTFDNQAAATVNPAAINPYFMNTAYRRPVNTPASDLGYSTMTPHGDDTSEQASTICVESSIIAVVGRDRYRPSSSSVSSTSQAILPPPPQHSRCRRPLLADVDDELHSSPDHDREPQTAVAEATTLLPHQFIADVQVHSLDVH